MGCPARPTWTHWSKTVRHYPIVNWRACTPTLDVLWSDWAVLVMLFSEGGTMVIPSASDQLSGPAFKFGVPSTRWRSGVTVWPSPLDPSDTAEPLTRRWDRHNHSCHVILPVGRWLYLSGTMDWYRLDRETFREERVYKLRPWKSSPVRPTLRPSSHYGIVFTEKTYNYMCRPFGQIKIHEGP